MKLADRRTASSSSTRCTIRSSGMNRPFGDRLRLPGARAPAKRSSEPRRQFAVRAPGRKWQGASMRKLAPRSLSASAAYPLATAAVLGTWLLRTGLDTWLGERGPFVLFVLPVVLAAMLGGRGPGLAAGLLSLAAGLSFIPAGTRTSPVNLIQTLIFALVCLGVGWLARLSARQQRLNETLRRAAEQEAAQSRTAREELHLLLEAATRHAIFKVGVDGSVATWNAGAERIFGWTEADVLGRHCSLFYPPQAQAHDRAMANLARAREEGRVAEETWQSRSDGSEFLAEMTITPMLGPGGSVGGYAKVIHDVSERRAAETALQRRERHLSSILDAVPEAMVVIDEAGTIISFSAIAERLFGYNESDVIGTNVARLMPAADGDRIRTDIERYLETGVRQIIGIGRIIAGLRADGRTVPMKLSVGETMVEGQRLFTCFLEDLTERRHFEARLEELQSELIHVARLSAMGTMASTLAHELNQPLSAIAAYGQAAGALLEAGAPIDRDLMQHVTADVAAQALRAGSIVRRLREFVARGEVSKTVEDLPALIGEASVLALVGSREKGIVSRFDYDPAATPVLADRVQIQQVLINLMRNAIEAMEDCPVRMLTVRTALLDPDTVQLSVTDTGTGLAPEMRDRLFEAFASTKSQGMGLGLSICRTIVEAHGGHIRACESEGGGA